MESGRRIKIMVSSRCKDKIVYQAKKQDLSELRKVIKETIVNIKPFGETLFECWINEDSPSIEATTDSWDQCLNQVKKADIVIVLYNGNPGWAPDNGGVGICHSELEKAISSGAAKVYAIRLPEVDLPTKPGLKKRFTRFRDYFQTLNLFSQSADTGEQVLELIPTVLHEAIVELVELGGRETRKGKYDLGDALDWSRQDFSTRKTSIESVVKSAILDRPGSYEEAEQVILPLGKKEVMVILHAVPAPLTTAAAREMVGRPFHYDYQYASRLNHDRGGPVHIIACHKGVTENQAIQLIGQPDIITVATGFGVLAVDQISNVQCIFLRNCRDMTTTINAVQRMFDWLSQSGEDELLIKRSLSRAKIAKVIADERS